MEPDWNGIGHFTALVEKETLTAAAEHLGVQHSTVARQIARLETALGLRLFDRIGKRYLLTADGERLHRHACGICKDMNMLHSAPPANRRRCGTTSPSPRRRSSPACS